MNPWTDPPDERLDAELDGRLSADERAALERDLAASPALRQELAALREARQRLRQALPAEPPPAGFEARLRRMLDDEDRRAKVSAPLPRSPVARTTRSGKNKTLWALAASIVFVLLSFFLWRGGNAPRLPSDPLQAAFEQFERFRETGLLPGSEARDAREIESRWQRGGIDFPARVLDLASLGAVLVGGDATDLGTRPAARTIYQADGRPILCWMFLGKLADLAPAAERRAHGGFDFHIFRRGELSLVVWQEGPVLCALLGDGDAESVIRLGMAKAMRA
jgi:anti-sigma factor RsiW